MARRSTSTPRRPTSATSCARCAAATSACRARSSTPLRRAAGPGLRLRARRLALRHRRPLPGARRGLIHPRVCCGEAPHETLGCTETLGWGIRGRTSGERDVSCLRPGRSSVRLRLVRRSGKETPCSAMHIPDGFIDGPTSLVAGARGHRPRRLVAADDGEDARRARGAGRRAGGGVRVRRADAQLPGRQRHQRPPAGRRAGRRARRAVRRRAGRHRGARRAGAAVRRRRAVGARASTSSTWRSSAPSPATACSSLVRRLLGRSAPSVRVGRRRRRRSPRRCWRPSPSPLEYAIGGNDAVSIGAVAGSMIGVHVLIGIGEGSSRRSRSAP